jgi:hypothetical protein
MSPAQERHITEKSLAFSFHQLLADRQFPFGVARLSWRSVISSISASASPTHPIPSPPRCSGCTGDEQLLEVGLIETAHASALREIAGGAPEKIDFAARRRSHARRGRLGTPAD